MYFPLSLKFIETVCFLYIYDILDYVYCFVKIYKNIAYIFISIYYVYTLEYVHYVQKFEVSIIFFLTT